MKKLNDLPKQELLNELKKTINEIKEILPKEVPFFCSNSSDPFRATILREACIYRIEEIAKYAYRAFEEDDLIVASILARSYMETEALFFELKYQIEEVLKTKEIKSLQEFLTRCLIGVKDEELKKMKGEIIGNMELIVSPINCLTLIQKVAKRIDKYEFHYNTLSERTHSNAAGTVNAFVQIDWEERKARLGKNKKMLDYNPSLVILVKSLEVFIDIYNDTADVLVQLSQLYEELGESIFSE